MTDPRVPAAAPPAPHGNWSNALSPCGGASGWGRCRSLGSWACRHRRFMRFWFGAGSTGCATLTGSPENQSAATNTQPRARCSTSMSPSSETFPTAAATATSAGSRAERTQGLQLHAAATSVPASTPGTAPPTSTQSWMTTPASPTPKSTPMRKPSPPSPFSNEPWHGSPPKGSPPNGSSPTTDPPTSPTPGKPPAPSWPSPRNEHAPTGPKPTARSKGSTEPSTMDGPTRSSTAPKPPDERPYPPGSTITITTGPTPHSGTNHPSAG
ncbi:hypothetical protein PJL15_04509 [Paenarthrobacter nitroguajacolicus]|nr:hypothetical protein [Paenarthrobacter nitroguajacolicus]